MTSILFTKSIVVPTLLVFTRMSQNNMKLYYIRTCFKCPARLAMHLSCW